MRKEGAWQRKLVIVDDEKEIADVVELYLKNEDYEVHKFYNGKDTLAFLEKEEPDLAILDVMLPDIDGFTILQKIRETYKFPVIMLTAKSEYLDKITGLTLGAGRLYCQALQSVGAGCPSKSAAASVYPVQQRGAAAVGQCDRFCRAFAEQGHPSVHL